MPYILDRFEDNNLAVLETDDGTTLDVPRSHIPPEAKEGDVLLELSENELDGEVSYAVDFDATTQRRREMSDLRASIPTVEEGDSGLGEGIAALPRSMWLRRLVFSCQSVQRQT